jgi:hypothetical protein
VARELAAQADGKRKYVGIDWHSVERIEDLEAGRVWWPGKENLR